MPCTERQKELLKAMEHWLMASDELMGRLEGFAKQHCAVFADATDENKLEYTQIYEQYQRLLEQELEGFLKSHGASQEEFVEACSSATAASGDEDVGAADFIAAMADFNEFKALMTSTYQAAAH